MHFPIRRGAFQRVVGHVKAVDGVVSRASTPARRWASSANRAAARRRPAAPSCASTSRPRARSAITDRSGKRRPRGAVEARAARPYRRDMRMIFQDPQSSLNPRLTVARHHRRGAEGQRLAAGSELEDRVAELMRRVGLRPEYMRRYPHAFSGGERQRIGIARALALGSAAGDRRRGGLGARCSVRAQTLNLLQDLQERVRPDLSLRRARPLSGRAHLRQRRRDVCRPASSRRRRPTTSSPAPATPTPRRCCRPCRSPIRGCAAAGARIRLAGEVADPAKPPPGCPFHPRCRYATDVCKTQPPPLRDVGGGHLAACHHAQTLSLKGVVSRAA